MGAKACLFGYIEDNAACSKKCEEIGIGYRFYLWKRDRRNNTNGIKELGYVYIIKRIDNSVLDESFLGKNIDSKTY